MKMQKKTGNKEYIGWVFFPVLFFASLFLTLNLHRNNGYFNWKSEIWADRAGYYIYLPSLFMYQFEAKECPEKIDEKTGYGFTLDYGKNTINTKYTYGVALLLSPFFVASHFISVILHKPGEAGFGPVYHKMINVAAVVYLILGLWILKRFLKYYFDSSIQYLILFFIYAGTNLLFYAVDDTLMSHVYSFFLFAVFLLTMKKFLDQPGRLIFFTAMCLAFALIILIRPSNILIILILIFWDLKKSGEIKERLLLLVTPKRILIFFLILLIVFLPQLIYWKYSRGSFFVYSYGNEGFTNWKNPRLPEVWFSTLNGLFLYTPMVVIFLAGIALMILKKMPNGILMLFLFLAVSYICASWYNWYFGCSFGQRSFVEYFAVFSIPFGYFIRDSLRIRNLLLKSMAILLIILFSYYNVRMILKFDKCFFGSTWDWPQFTRQLERANIFSAYNRPYSFQNDFENQALSSLYNISDSAHLSGMYSAKVDPDKEFIPFHSIPMSDLPPKLPRYINVEFWLFDPGMEVNEAQVVCSIDKNDSSLVWQSQPLAPIVKKNVNWQKITNRFILPDGLTREPVIKIYLWNQKRSSFFVDDLKIMLD